MAGIKKTQRLIHPIDLAESYSDNDGCDSDDDWIWYENNIAM